MSVKIIPIAHRWCTKSDLTSERSPFDLGSRCHLTLNPMEETLPHNFFFKRCTGAIFLVNLLWTALGAQQRNWHLKVTVWPQVTHKLTTDKRRIRIWTVVLFSSNTGSICAWRWGQTVWPLEVNFGVVHPVTVNIEGLGENNGLIAHRWCTKSDAVPPAVTVWPSGVTCYI